MVLKNPKKDKKRVVLKNRKKEKKRVVLVTSWICLMMKLSYRSFWKGCQKERTMVRTQSKVRVEAVYREA